MRRLPLILVLVASLLVVVFSFGRSKSLTNTMRKLVRGKWSNDMSGQITLPNLQHQIMKEQIEKAMLMDKERFPRRQLSEESAPDHIVRISELVHKVAQNNRVYVTFTNYPYLDQFYVLYMTSKLWRYPNFMVVAIDQKTYDILSQQGFPVALVKASYLERYSNDYASNYGDHNFNILVKMKLVIINRILAENVACLMFDSDVIMFKDPLEDEKDIENYDFIAQVDEHICTGFMYFNPTRNSMLLMEQSLLRMRDREMNDQDIIQEIIMTNVISGIKWKLFPSGTYSKGSIYFNAHQFPWTPTSPDQVMVHNNYVIGHKNKVYRLREAGLYAFDVNQEYSNPDAKYITLEHFTTSHMNSNALVVMVNIANALDRHFVVPEMPCNNGLTPPCNLCGYETFHCMKDSLEHANLQWKEHVFFNNPYVPSDVKLSYLTTPIIHFKHTKQECKEVIEQASVTTRCFVRSTYERMSNKALLELLQDYSKEKVIRIQEIPDDMFL